MIGINWKNAIENDSESISENILEFMISECQVVMDVEIKRPLHDGKQKTTVALLSF